MTLKDAPYYDMWERRYRPLHADNYYLWMEFSSQYFAKLKRELESAGYEVTILEDGHWYSEPVGWFDVSSRLRGEWFMFFVMG
jgi:hypothetical protein